MISFILRCLRWCAHFARLQLFLTLFCLPVLILWGLPFSVLSPIGNLVFSPILTAHLLLSSLIFFCELIWIPNDWLIWCLQYLTHWWIACMELVHSTTWSIGFINPPIVVLLALFVATVGIMLHKRTNSLYTSLALLSLLFTLFCAYAYWLRPRTHMEQIPCNKGLLTLVRNRHTTTLIDPGYLGQRLSAPSWVQYTLMPAIIKKTGSITLDTVIVLQPSIVTFEALTRLCLKMRVGTIYIPFWHGNVPALNKAYRALKQQMAARGCQLKRLGFYPIASDNGAITICSTDKKITEPKISFVSYMVQIQIDNHIITIYPAKCAHKNMCSTE